MYEAKLMSEQTIDLDLKDAVVMFDLWGQSCKTKFSSASELDPVTWIKTCYEKGFIHPVAVVSPDGTIIYSEEQLQEMVAEL